MRSILMCFTVFGRLLIFRFDLKLSHTINIRIVSLNIEIKEPIEEIIFQDKNVLG